MLGLTCDRPFSRRVSFAFSAWAGLLAQLSGVFPMRRAHIRQCPSVSGNVRHVRPSHARRRSGLDGNKGLKSNTVAGPRGNLTRFPILPLFEQQAPEAVTKNRSTRRHYNMAVQAGQK